MPRDAAHVFMISQLFVGSTRNSGMLSGLGCRMPCVAVISSTATSMHRVSRRVSSAAPAYGVASSPIRVMIKLATPPGTYLLLLAG